MLQRQGSWAGQQAQAWWPSCKFHSLTFSTVLRFRFSARKKEKGSKKDTFILSSLIFQKTIVKHVLRITLVWTDEAANKPCKELMAALPPSGSQGSRVSPGEAPWLHYSRPSFLLRRPCLDADRSRNVFWSKLPLNPAVPIWIHQNAGARNLFAKLNWILLQQVCFPLFQVGIFQAPGHFQGTPAGHFNYTLHAWRHIMRQEAWDTLRQEMKNHYTRDIR